MIEPHWIVSCVWVAYLWTWLLSAYCIVMCNSRDLIKNYKKDGGKEIPRAHPSTSRSSSALEYAQQNSVSRCPAVFHHMIPKHNAVFIHFCLLGAHWGRTQLAGSARKTCSTSKPESTSSWIKQSPFTQVSSSSYWSITFSFPSWSSNVFRKLILQILSTGEKKAY